MNTLRSRYRQAHKEAHWSIGLAIAYFIWWYASAYLFTPSHTDDTALLLGLPLWFVFACVIGPLVFTIFCGLMVKFVFKDMSLDVASR
ncbi:hypothetical protein CS022_16105 [Veronia nyctiphanis]|uniref:DUF997 domain-containing protein n=1 Tax=Veronia nyctiphanis TaxID=1278244 RepID=A0A4Q0YTM3_9GAMM|nr:YhdT family protein [Veronia nyctiphanis]RXJ72351.1 hypothetical protein CS022_16105 [Veronia nyctiphanis]